MLAIMPMLLFFPYQNMVDNLNAKRERAFDNIVQQHVQRARLEGYFTNANITELRSKLVSVFYINESEITINVTTTPKYRTVNFDENELINYDISAPLKKVYVMQSYWGFTDTQNTRNNRIQGEVASERLP